MMTQSRIKSYEIQIKSHMRNKMFDKILYVKIMENFLHAVLVGY